MLRDKRAARAMMLVVAASGCSHAAPPEARAPVEPEVVLSPEGRPPVRVRVEVARSEAETQRGLMFRDKLEAGRGMLFLFPQPRHMVFWMHNTYIPLDMIFITTAHRVLGVVESATPLTDDPRGVEGDSQFVLEVPGGWAAKNGVGPGTPARFVGLVE